MSKYLENNNFISKKPLGLFVEELNKQRKCKRFTDVQIKIETTLFDAHRNVLSINCPYFDALLSEQWSNNNCVCEISSDFAEISTFESLLDFIYTGKIVINGDNAHSLCITCRYLQINELSDACEAYLSHNIFEDNVYELLKFSTTYDFHRLYVHCVAYLCRNLSKLNSKIVEFSEEEFQEMIQIINKENSEQITKQMIYDAVIKWIDYRFEERKHLTTTFMNLIPLQALSIDFLENVVVNDKKVAYSNACTSIIFEAFTNNIASMGRTMIYCSGGVDGDSNAKSSISCYDSRTGRWQNLASMSPPRIHYGFTAAWKYLYFAGGLVIENRRKRSLSKFEYFDIEDKIWKQAADLPYSCYGLSMAKYNNSFYITGGVRSMMERISRVEKYTPERDEWQTVCSMRERRTNHQMVELNNCLFAIGGLMSRTVERYDCRTNNWMFVGSMNHEHSDFGATVHNGKIYVCSANGFEVYIPEYNLWQVLSIPTNRKASKLVTIHNKIWSLGGCGLLENEPTNQVHEYDPEKDAWNRIADMDEARWYHNVVKTLF